MNPFVTLNLIENKIDALLTMLSDVNDSKAAIICSAIPELRDLVKQARRDFAAEQEKTENESLLFADSLLIATSDNENMENPTNVREYQSTVVNSKILKQMIDAERMLGDINNEEIFIRVLIDCNNI